MEPDASNFGRIVEVVSLGNTNNKPGPSKIKPKLHSTQPATEKPLLMLIKLLVNFAENEQKTMLTNSQLMNILQKEFDINIWDLPTLAVDIYMNVLKKFLKTWPRWDSVDNIVQCSKVDKSIEIETILLKEYDSLKAYLKATLDLSREPVEATLKKIKSACNVSNESKGVLEVHCSRQQLDTLFYRQPDPMQQMTIFNSNPAPNYGKIRLLNIELSQLVNWLGVSIEIDVAKIIQYTRRNNFGLSHMLVNHKLGRLPEPPVISRYVHSRSKSKTNARSEVSNETVKNLLNYLLELLNKQSQKEHVVIVKTLLETIKTDLSHCPKLVDRNCEYMYFMNSHPYVRHLFQEIPQETAIDATSVEKQEMEKYDLELLEYISPNIVFNISTSLKMRIDGTMPDTSGHEILVALLKDKEQQWLHFHCTYCGIKFHGLSSVFALRLHMRELHCEEPNPACSKCNRSFTIPELANKRWFHRC